MAKAAKKTKSSKAPRRAARKEGTRASKRARSEEPETLPLFGEKSLEPAASKKAKGASAVAVAEPPVEVVSESPRARRAAPNRPSSAETIGQKQRKSPSTSSSPESPHAGFRQPARHLTAAKEAVDNSLDACEEAGLADIVVEIHELAEVGTKPWSRLGSGDRACTSTKIFGKLLYGSKFHELRQSRGQQGIGISAAVMYSQLTTEIRSSRAPVRRPKR